MIPQSPPESYQQWLDCFQYLCQHPADTAMLEALEEGSYLGIPSENFLCRLSDTLGIVLTARCRRFLSQVDTALMDGEPDMVPLLAVRFRKGLRRCFFYRRLPFLPEAYVRELDEGYTEQIQSFWTRFLTQLRISVQTSGDPRLEDLLLTLKRVNIMQREG